MDAVAIVLALVVFALMLGLYGRWIGYERCGRFGLVVSLIVFGYLVYALMRGERL